MWCSPRDLNSNFTAFETVASAVGLEERGASQRIRTFTERGLKPLPLPVGLEKHGVD